MTIKWTDELIKEKIFEVMETLEIERMPSNSEIKTITESCALGVKISRTGGFYKWAEKLGLDIKNSETKTGINYEEKALEIIKNKGFEAELTSTKCPYDILVNDNIRIDVKVANINYIRGSRAHTFGLNHKCPTCDLYLMIALDENKEPERIFIIPSIYMKFTTTTSIGKKSIYDKYKDRWDLIDKFDKFYKEI